uniref:Xanthine dehydrogenase n=1 Tax=Culicoides sonorensis TaxID=179676 RepID=A0A336MW54_CULSO
MDFKPGPLIFFVNGKKIIEPNPQPEQLLLHYLRENLHLTGTKEGCSEGGCGACTVMLSKYNRSTNEIKHFAVVACLIPVCSVHGMAITTIEGIGNTRQKLHPVQERIAKAHGIQCGFCTPGFVMSMYALLRNDPVPKIEDIEKAFQGNLCRCTGYRPIFDGYKTFSKEFKEKQMNGNQNCAMGEKCCKNKNVEFKLFDETEFAPYDPTQEIIFPPELKSSDVLDKDFLIFKNSRLSWFRPVTLDQLKWIKMEYPDSRILAGNTEIGIEIQTKPENFKNLIFVDKIPEMNFITSDSDGIKFGANVTLSDLEKFLKIEISKGEESKLSLYKTLLETLHWFSGTQIRNVATAVGNIMTASPISDLNPVFLVCSARLEVMCSDGTMKTVTMDSNFFTGYRQTILNKNDTVLSIFIPKSGPNDYYVSLKQSRRREDDIAIVNFAIKITIGTNSRYINCAVDDIQIAFGGLGPQIIMPLSDPEFGFKGVNRRFDRALLSFATTALIKYLIKNLPKNAPGGEVTYRQSLAARFMFKAFWKIYYEFTGKPELFFKMNLDEEKIPIKSLQLFEKVDDAQNEADPVGRPMVVASAYKQSTGEAIFCDDIPRFENELALVLVTSTKAHAKILNINADEALKQEGVRGFFSAKDLTPEKNQFGLILNDETVFSDGLVKCYGEVVGAIVAETKSQARIASRLVKIEYEELPSIFTIEEAIEKKSFFNDEPMKLENGDVDNAFNEAFACLDGTFRTGKQEHFYLEPQSSIVVPRDSDEMEIFSATQWPENIQKRAAQVMGVPQSKITVRVKRIGGGFGGKETRCLLIALPCVVAADKLKQPVRCTLTRQEDMLITGTRNSILFKYKVGFTKDGYLTGLDVKLWLNAGCTMDYSCLVVQRAIFHVQNAYNIPNIRCRGWTCKTNTVSNTAFRGFGSPQSMMIAEEAIRQVARYLKVDYVTLMDKNLYREGHLTHYNQKLVNCNVERCFREVLASSCYESRKAEVAKFNEEHGYNKRGITVVPTVFGLGYVPVFLNQAGALIHVYTDGSVLLSHGGVEIGQGLHTKMIQIASRTLEIPADLIHIQETATDKVPNASSTAASTASDLNGMAVLNTCQIIKERIAPYKAKYPDKDWKYWIHNAYMDRVSLSATGFFKQTDIGYDEKTNQGNAFYYFVYGAAVAEVEIDVYTGDHLVHRVDIVMDLGRSINPAVDVGQIEGAFMQGYGLYTMEEIWFYPDGRQHTVGPSTYKIPTLNDIPKEFNVSLLTGAPNPRAVCSSKAVGEPPLFMASAVFFAIKDAIIAARAEINQSPEFEFNAPATAARIHLACDLNCTTRFMDKNGANDAEQTSNNVRPWAFPV